MRLSAAVFHMDIDDQRTGQTVLGTAFIISRWSSSAWSGPSASFLAAFGGIALLLILVLLKPLGEEGGNPRAP